MAQMSFNLSGAFCPSTYPLFHGAGLLGVLDAWVFMSISCVPLSRQAVELLQALPRLEGSDWVFWGARKPTISNMAMLELLRGMRPGLTVHGFRSSFSDWAAESTHFPSQTVEMALAHTITNPVEAAYRRGDLIEKRRELMQAWGDYLDGAGQAGETGALVPAQAGQTLPRPRSA